MVRELRFLGRNDDGVDAAIRGGSVYEELDLAFAVKPI